MLTNETQTIKHLRAAREALDHATAQGRLLSGLIDAKLDLTLVDPSNPLALSDYDAMHYCGMLSDYALSLQNHADAVIDTLPEDPQ
jgi:hypothetical protein